MHTPLMKTWQGPAIIDWFLASAIVLNIAMAVVIRLIGSIMYPFFFAIYLWIAVYAALLSLLLRRSTIIQTPVINSRFAMVIVIFLVLVSRLVFLGQDQLISLDPLWYLDFGKFMMSDKIPYFGFYFPYPPVFAYFILLISQTIPSIDAFRVLSSLADIGVTLLLWKIVTHEMDSKWASIIVLAYALLPISIIESGWNGHFESLANLFMLLGIWLMLSRKPSLSGISMGLATATKFYPGLLLPVMLFKFQGWKHRVQLILAALVSYAATYLPIFILSFLRPDASEGSVASSSSVGFANIFETLFRALQYIISTTLITFLAFVGIAAGIILVAWHLTHDNTGSRGYALHWITLALGLLLILLGLIAGIYPLLPMSRVVYWRYPADIGVVRGITTIASGLILVIISVRALLQHQATHYDSTHLITQVSGIILLLSTLIRKVWYGWYLLWSFPLFLLGKRKKIVLTLILCLLWLYPSYTHDNFVSLGINEPRFWNDEFTSIGEWTTYVNTSTTGIDSHLIPAYIDSINGIALFKFDTTKIQNETLLENVSITYTRNVSFAFDDMIEFVTRIMALWDPTFGAYASLSLSYSGITDSNESIHGMIVHRTRIFTNLTYVLWRYAFFTDYPHTSGVIQELVLTIHPLRSVSSAYALDFFYTTYAGPYNPLYFITVPYLVAISLVAYTVLKREIDRYESAQEHPNNSDG